MKKFFPRLTVRDLCILGLITAITALLSIFFTFRIGTIYKFPLKFISVFVTAVLYGPFWGGICAAIGDILNCFIAPVGPFVPQITVLEFISGFVFGLFFLKCNISKKSYIKRVLLCSIAQLILASVLNTTVYAYWLKWYPDFSTAFAIRIPACLLNCVLHLIILIPIYSTTEHLKQHKAMGK